MREAPLFSPRETCHCCLRPETHCICTLVTPFRLHCNLLILQHPRERRRYYGTVKIVQRAIENSRVLTGMQFSTQDFPPDLSEGPAYLLFPGDDALLCSAVNLERNSTLVVLDGTWAQAKKMLRLSPPLQRLPRLSFARKYVSTYRIRGQPDLGCLSTIEALAYFLRESSTQAGSLDGVRQRRQAAQLLAAFGTMVERQIACWRSWKPLPHELAPY